MAKVLTSTRAFAILRPPQAHVRTFLGLSGYSKNLKGKIKERKQQMKQQKRAGGLRGHPRDSPEVQLSKTVTWLLRHGAKSEGLSMREDGYVRVRDLLATTRLRSLDFPRLEEMVRKDSKNRFNLIHEPKPGEDGWWIRANQGHSMQDVKVDYVPLTSADQVPMAVHGTNRQAWEVISKEGLSKMKRTHIHLAQGVPGSGVISGMRASADILIHIDLARALAAGIPFFLSANGVVLTAGDARGFLAPEFFSRVETRKGEVLPGWEGSIAERSAIASMEQEKIAPTNEEASTAVNAVTVDIPGLAVSEKEAVTRDSTAS